jgi:hypothetical protein
VNLLIKCELTAPPSEIGAFRCLTLHATVFEHLDCLIVSDPEVVDFYYRWIKRNYAWDFVKQFVKPNEVSGVEIHHQKITFNNLNTLIDYISYSKKY